MPFGCFDGFIGRGAVLLERVALATAAAQIGNLFESLDHLRLLPSLD